MKESISESSNFNNTIIAYEPVWAIGSGLTPTLEEINQTHDFIKNHNLKFFALINQNIEYFVVKNLDEAVGDRPIDKNVRENII